MSDTTTTSFSAATTSTTISESTPAGEISTTTTTTADSLNPTPATFTFTSSSLLSNSTSSLSTFSTPSTSTSTSSTEDPSTDSAEIAPEEESTAQYAPVVKLQEVAVTTGEEDDEVIYTQRAALYRFDSSVNEWKERGKGDVRLLQNKTTGKVRALMRQEKTLKLCINHLVLPGLELKANAGSDRSWTWRCKDFAGEVGEDQTFAIRFKDSEIANGFKEKWNEVREKNAKLMEDKH